MKIGIFTLSLFKNYGGILQNFALQKVLRDLGHSPITIDRCPKCPSLSKYYLSQAKHLVNKLRGKNKDCFYTYQNYKRSKPFSTFLNKYIKRTNRISRYSKDSIEKNQFDAVIVGSDQVWRRSFHSEEVLKNYYLDLLVDSKVLKIAYAASFGINYWDYEEDLTKECRELITRFKGVSTREDSGVELCRQYLNVEAAPVSDPTLLLEHTDYDKVSKKVPINESKYILAYVLANPTDYQEQINRLSQQLGIQVKIVEAELKAKISVEEWIAMIRDATFVITDSFHGTVFSIIYNKPFATIINSVRGADRFHSLLNRFNLSDRIIKDDLPINTTSIDWDKVNYTRKEWKQKSIKFLQNMLSK